MVYTKDIKVVMLPTGKKAHQANTGSMIVNSTDKSYFGIMTKKTGLKKVGSTQLYGFPFINNKSYPNGSTCEMWDEHKVYVVSEETPNVGDWMLQNGKTVTKVTYPYVILEVDQKIIATYGDELESVPQISKESLMEYSEKFDKISKISRLKLEENSKFLQLIF